MILLRDAKSSGSVTEEDIQAVVNNQLVRSEYPNVDPEELAAQLEADLDIYTGEITELTEESVVPWLNEERGSIDWSLWDRYKEYLRLKDASFPVDNLDDLTDRILDKCVNPKRNGSWDRRGMVVGNVQSGKTANYIGLVNKATDAGYKLVIVIAGVHNTLRSQTQARVDEGFIGRDSSDFITRKVNTRIGVGEFAANKKIYSFTSSESKGDFNRSIASRLTVPIDGADPTVLVIKKNKSILENLILWLNQYAIDGKDGQRKIINVPMLLIDDEADNASVNSGTELDVRTINRLIRTLLNLFDQNTFIGYTATPYANLFIPSSWSSNLETSVKGTALKVGEDLFPRNFIINIPAPSNYIGAAQVFGFENRRTGRVTEGLDIIRYVDDQEPWFPRKINKDNKDDLPEDIPESLKESLMAFILTCAIRRHRGQVKKHNSMLVHVALRVDWIDRIAFLVNEVIRDYKRQIKSGQGSLLNDLQDLYEADFVPTTEDTIENLTYSDPKIKPAGWEDISGHILDAVSRIDVRAVHGRKKTGLLEYHNIEEIDYRIYEEADSSLSVIAVGGNKLARGITLEGLSVSYYLRTTRMYDSLMQMGRWFGYRPGYVDLCRLYTTDQLVDWYRHVTMATEEMRDDFDELASRNMQPKDFQLKVRTHPGMLMITSVARMREHEKIRVSFSGKLIQTYSFSTDQLTVSNNYATFKNLLVGLPQPEIKKSNQGVNGLLWRNIESEMVKDFLGGTNSSYIRPEVIKGYIDNQNANGLLGEWSVAVILNSQNIVSTKGKLNGLEVLKKGFAWSNDQIVGGLPARNLEEGSTEVWVKGSKNAILDKRARIIDLDLTLDASEKSIKAKRTSLGTPLLVLMPLDPRVSDKLDVTVPLCGFGIMFPEVAGETVYEYAARPLIEEFDTNPQEDDDSDESGD